MRNEFLENWHSQLKKGLLSLYVLCILYKKECYGYELINNIKEEFEIDVAEGTLYPLLIRLLKDGLLAHQWIEQPSGIPRKYYSITSAGKKNLKEMKGYTNFILSKVNK